MGPHDQLDAEDLTEEYSEGTLSRCSSVDKMSLTPLPEGLVDERFRVDRRKLEVMIQGRLPEPCEAETMRLPLASDGSLLSADEFFAEIMRITDTEIKYPKFLKVGARNKKDPHVRVVGLPEGVRQAGAMVRQELEPLSRVTMKLDVSWTYHSHIIGKGGNTIQPVVKRAGVSIHFPDGNKTSDVNKSNQVSVNSRGNDLTGLEDARCAIRNLTPLIFTFSLSATAQFIRCPLVDSNSLSLHVQNIYNVQVELRLTEEVVPLILGSVRGNETDAQRVKEATLYIIHSYCDSLATQMPVQMSMEISPSQRSFVLGRNNEYLKSVMQKTSTRISIPDMNDLTLPPSKKSTLVITGSIDNVYLARQNILGALPLALMFDLVSEQVPNEMEVDQLSQSLGVNIHIKSRRIDGRHPVTVKGAERNAGNIYEAWHILTRAEKAPPKADIPALYNMSEVPTYAASTELSVNPCLWLGGSSGGSSLAPSPSSTPAPPSLVQSQYTALWGNLNSSSNLFSQQQQQQQQLLYEPRCSSAYYNPSLHRTSFGSTYSSSNAISQPTGNSSLSHLVSTFSTMSLSNGDGSCGNSSNSESSLSSPTPSPRNPSPDQIVAHLSHNKFSEPEASGGSAFSALNIDRRAPGCEKKQIEMQKLTSLADYNSKKMQAVKAMKEQVSASPRTPTSNWSGCFFSRSTPGHLMRKEMQEARLQRDNQLGPGLHDNALGLAASQPPAINLSASSYMDCILPRPKRATSLAVTASKSLDITSILVDLKLEQYIDLFTAQDVDLNMFMNLTDADLKELGITIFGHRRKIQMAVKDLAAMPAFGYGGTTVSLDHGSTLLETGSVWD